MTRQVKTKKKQSHFFLDERKFSVFLIILTIGLYSNTLFHNYALDDAIVIYENDFTTQGIKGIPDLFSHDTFHGFFKEEGKSQLVSGGRYRPLTPALFALEWELFGKSPLIGHLINILLFAFLAVVAYQFLLFLSGKKKQAFWVSAIGIILFVVHPIHTEVVANIKGRDEICALLFGLLSILVFYRSRSPYKKLFSAVFIFLALLSKESSIALVALFPLIDYVKNKYSFVTAVKNGWSIYVAAVIYIGLRMAVIGVDMGEKPNELMNNPFIKVVGSDYIDFDFQEKIASIFYALALDIKLLLVPHPLTHDYYPRFIEVVGLDNPWSLLGLFSSVAILILGFIWLRKRNINGLALAIYFIPLLLVSNILFPIGTHLSERFLFIPSLGFCLLAGSLLVEYIPNKKILMVLIGVVSLLMAAKTVDRNKAWKDNFTLFTTDISNSPNSAKLNNAVAGELIATSQEETSQQEKNRLLDRAIGFLGKAVEIHPRYKNAHLLLGNASHYKGDYTGAITHYQRALSLDSQYDEAIGNMAKTYREMKDFESAEMWFEKLLEMGVDRENIRMNLSLTYEQGGMYFGQMSNRGKAIEYFEKGLKLGGEEAKFYYFLGIAYAQTGESGKAIDYLEKALEFPVTPENRKNIYNALFQLFDSIGDVEKSATYAKLLKDVTG